ncbi:inorganic phosphate transporter [Prevotella communis]|uniref:inorganic phosphate transporter n=1 Tax=Prevotella communis TaxID=2913614 RepID=UPI001EDC39C0|nr:inorganic phosphate transporter [Prevotella communis]UKK58392.1 inorganic phosphate transporter [Prevotella communis]
MNTLFLIIVIFLIVLAVFDLMVGVSNDAVNFLNSAIGARVARYRTVVAIAAIGVFIGAALSNGMMDVARNGIMTPAYFSFYDVMCVFLAVMITDVILLDVFNTLGMPTSTTVSMVFELLGGAFAIAILQIMHGATASDGTLLSLGDLLNTEKAISVILGIFLSVAIAFVFGMLVQWVARIVFTFTYRVNGRTTDQKGKMGSLLTSSLKIGIFGGLSVTVIVWFLLINGLKNSSLMTPEMKALISENTWLIIGGGIAVFSVLMTLLSALKLPVLKCVVLFGTFALAMAFAGNDLVNFVGVPLTGLEAYQDYIAHGSADAQGFMMKSLMEGARTPAVYLIAAGVVMVLALVFSKKAQNVVKTSVDLSRQDEGDEMFGASGVARTLVRTSRSVAGGVAAMVPGGMARWIDSRFNADAAVLKQGAAFDEIRAAVNLVLAGALVALGTSLKLPLSTTYVTFMVAMGASLADRAWSRESAVFRITGVLSVIGGWFITAGVAFILCFLVCIALFFGSFMAMVAAIALAIFLLIRSHLSYKKSNKTSEADELFDRIIRSSDKTECWRLLRLHVTLTITNQLQQVAETYKSLTDAFFYEDYRMLKRTTAMTENQRKDIKRQRRKQIVAQRRIDPVLSIEKGTWYFLTINSLAQMVYCLKRMGEPCLEHVGNNFSPVPGRYIQEFLQMRNEILQLITRASHAETMDLIRGDANKMQSQLSDYRQTIIHDIQAKQLNIESMTVFLNLVQESQQILSALRHTMRGLNKFEE